MLLLKGNFDGRKKSVLRKKYKKNQTPKSIEEDEKLFHFRGQQRCAV